MEFLELVLKEMKDPIFMHLRMNHFPVILILVAAAGAVVAIVTKRDGVWRYALVSAVIAGLTSPIAWWTGRRAMEKAEDYTGLDVGMMVDHEESAMWAMIALLAATLVSGLALVKPATALRWIAVAGIVVAAGLTAYTGAQAGHIAHGKETMKLLR
jgi:uncharacterized membrane protein